MSKKPGASISFTRTDKCHECGHASPYYRAVGLGSIEKTRPAKSERCLICTATGIPVIVSLFQDACSAFERGVGDDEH